MGLETYKKLTWALIGALIGTISVVPSLWLSDAIAGGLIGFAVVYAIAAFVLRRRANAETVDA